ncbi:hypothetical protein BDY21DRAFT_90226 [Lineolata rhizophorae]|uniref:GPI-anchored cell wall organization protein Ecm33 n=1 Tax=Lineolata rhizophorae TaxID=578093 RepID=A0A6A6PC82_9PEZI|nr:hypothetical protein BDY21DRAFT_90226 [Lineolata rhizophorae]
MTLLKYALPALAVAGTAAAQCSASTTTIQNSGDATALASCTTFTGSIAIATGTVDNIELNGIRTIRGSLIANNVTEMTTLRADSLEEIEDTFDLQQLTILSTLDMPALTKVDTIRWQALPALQGLNFETAVQEAGTVDIQNTELNSLDGINLKVVDVFYIANNRYLESMDLQLSNITNALTMEANAPNLEVSFPNLEWAFNMTLRNVSSLSIPSLEHVNGSFGLYSNFFETFSAPNLTTIEGDLSFVDNGDLTNITMPVLELVEGGFQIENNSQLTNINGFPELATVGGALDFTGDFQNVSLPAIDDVRGAFNMQSTEDISDACDHFEGMAGQNDVIKGEFTCDAEEDNPSSIEDGDNNDDDDDSDSSNDDDEDAAGHIRIPGAVLAFSAFLAALFGLL